MNQAVSPRLDGYPMTHSTWAVFEPGLDFFVSGPRFTSPRQRVGLPHLNP